MGGLSGVRSYFNLEGVEVLFGGGGTRTARELSLYIGVLLGALSKVIYDASVGDAPVEARGFVLAAIGSIVSFPALFRKAHLNKGPLNPMKYFVAFQNGFFWSLVLDGIARQFAP